MSIWLTKNNGDGSKSVISFSFPFVFAGMIILGVISSFLAPKLLSQDVNSQNSFDWKTKGPLEFIEELKQSKDNSYIIKNGPADKNWISQKHLPDLIKLINSTERCANVTSVWSSYWEKNWSTVGNEAAYLIDGYRKGKYPHQLNSTRPKPDIEDILNWWHNFKKKSPD